MLGEKAFDSPAFGKFQKGKQNFLELSLESIRAISKSDSPDIKQQRYQANKMQYGEGGEGEIGGGDVVSNKYTTMDPIVPINISAFPYRQTLSELPVKSK